MYAADNLDYIRSRLTGTVVRLKDNQLLIVDEALRADDRKDKYKVLGSKLLGMNSYERVTVLSDDLILNSPTLGYVNSDGDAIYIGRLPKRRDWKQGLRRENMFSMIYLGRLGTCIIPDLYLLSQPIQNKYPKYIDCLDRIDDIFDSSAFSKNFAINKKRELLFKNEEVVGRANDDGPKLGENFFWLDECLKEDLA